MHVKSISRELNSLNISEEYLNRLKIYHEDCCESIKVGKFYLVLGISANNGDISYLIDDTCIYSTPHYYPCEFFEIIDNRLSKFWIFANDLNFNKDKQFYESDLTINFKEWATNEFFYGYLIDSGDNPEQYKIYYNYRELMENEFPDPSIQFFAKKIHEKWFECPHCEEYFEDNNVESKTMLRCPNNNCWKLLHNPFYKDEVRDEYLKKMYGVIID